MKVRVPPIGIEIEGIIHREDRFMAGGSSAELNERLKASLGEFVSFEGGSSNSGARLFEVKTNPSTNIKQATEELTGHLRAMHNVMSAYHREENFKMAEKNRQIDEDIAGMDEEERRDYFAWGDPMGKDESHQRLMFAGSKPMVGGGSGGLADALNPPEYGNTGNYASGIHIHAGVPFEEHEQVVKKLEPYAPLLTALTASSPFDHQGNPEWASYRMMERINRTSFGEPLKPYFHRYGGGTSRDRDLEFTPNYNAGKSLRPETVECVVMDSTSSLEDIACVAAIYQGLVCKAMHEAHMDCRLEGAEKLDPERTGNMSRICKDGLDAELICVDDSTMTAKEAVGEMLDELSPYLKALGTEEMALHAETIMREGTSADRQVKLFNDENRKFEVDGRREAVLEHISQGRHDKSFEALSPEEQDELFEPCSWSDSGLSHYEEVKRSQIADIVERSVVRESLEMARAGRGKQTEEQAYAMSESKVDHLEVEETLSARGQVLEVEVDLSQKNAESEKEQNTLVLA
ncbi:MAG: glutamate-cysteine ligase family protein [Pseudomonadota bacterium]|nr:glutamate-cysteine ligase family protein [Pseudomonadota bacterium]